MNLGDRLRVFAAKNFGSLTGLAKELGISLQHLSPYINEKSEFGTPMLRKLAELGCDINWLLTGEKAGIENIVKEQGITYVPIEEALINGKIHYPQLQVMAQVPAGKGEIKYSVDDEYFKFELDPRMYFVLRVDEEYGFSMQPFLKPGDFVICHINNKNIKSGDLVVVRYDGTKGAIKKYVFNPDLKDVVVLESINKSEDPIILKQSQIIDKYKIQAFWKK